MPRFLAIHEFDPANIAAVLVGGGQLVEAAARGNLPEDLNLIWAFVAYPSRPLIVGLWEAPNKEILEATFEPFKDVFKTEFHECLEVFPPGPDFVTFTNKFYTPAV
ncbi:MAG: hypothetical protein ACETWM_20415 [Candidatus Lokiarchaeia archaeon]